ncbi:type 2 periplasmic-binding domain-containing protein [Novosphingobium rosa]|uniref:carbohydrate ABC transporter substrate-binding protein n=1 Tax=Novosphingobium rosa TaxID=76978 RepID=UPI001FDF3BCC|nr:carbohydrate ABC transporter substrate-binding protein [Novosphingobium rosa]
MAASRAWEAETGEAITWDRRSLQDFETFPVGELARHYDLIVIDHPHVGHVAAAGCLAPLDGLVAESVLEGIAAGSVGGSYESYRWAGHQWALPIDAASQVQAWVPGRIPAPVTRFEDLQPLLAAGRVMVPLRAPHGLMTLFSLCGLAGFGLDVEAQDLFPVQAAAAYDRLRDLAAAIDPAAWSMDPIAVFEAMADPASPIAVAPFIYGYVSYARDGFRSRTIHFADVPVFNTQPVGTALGGTGLAVSALGDDPSGAARFAAWVAGGALQRDLVAAEGGQPAHAEAWGDDGVNRATHDFYRATRRTLDQAWLRPRHDGYMAFQDAASHRLEEALRRGETATDALAALNTLYRQSR